MLLPASLIRLSARPSGFIANPSLLPGLVPYDLTRGGSTFVFRGQGNIDQYGLLRHRRHPPWAISPQTSVCATTSTTACTTKNGIQPRLGLSYHVHPLDTVLRVAYARTFETPFNENLLLSSATGVGGLDQNIFGAKADADSPGRRNQFNGGPATGCR